MGSNSMFASFSLASKFSMCFINIILFLHGVEFNVCFLQLGFQVLNVLHQYYFIPAWGRIQCLLPSAWLPSSQCASSILFYSCMGSNSMFASFSLASKFSMCFINIGTVFNDFLLALPPPPPDAIDLGSSFMVTGSFEDPLCHSSQVCAGVGAGAGGKISSWKASDFRGTVKCKGWIPSVFVSFMIRVVSQFMMFKPRFGMVQ